MPRLDLKSVPKKDILVALFIALSGFSLFFGYEFIRSSSNTLVKQAYGRDVFAYLMAAVIFAVVLALNGYGRLITRFGPRKTLRYTIAGSAFAFLGIYYGIRAEMTWLVVVLYLVREIYVVLIVEQYWSYATSVFSVGSGKRLNGFLLAISGSGGIVSGFLVEHMAESLGTVTMLLFCVGSALPCAIFAELAYNFGGEPQETPTLLEAVGNGKSKTVESHIGLDEFKKDRLLVYLLLLILSTQVLSASLNLEFQGAVLDYHVGQPDKETAFWGWFFKWINIGAVTCQLFLAPVLLVFFRSRWVLLAVPLVHLATITFANVSPSLFTVGLAYFLFKVFDYSLYRAAKEILYIPLSYNVRFRAKEVIDVFGYRAGKGGTGLAFTLLKVGGVAISGFYAPLALFAAGFWTVVTIPILKRGKREGLD